MASRSGRPRRCRRADAGHEGLGGLLARLELKRVVTVALHRPGRVIESAMRSWCMSGTVGKLAAGRGMTRLQARLYHPKKDAARRRL